MAVLTASCVLGAVPVATVDCGSPKLSPLSLTLRVVFDENFTPDERALLAEGLASWECVLPELQPDVSYEPHANAVNDFEDDQITVVRVEGGQDPDCTLNDPDAGVRAVGETWWFKREAYICLDAKYLDETRVPHDWRRVFAHELGHALGLPHKCGDEGLPKCSDVPPTIMATPDSDTADEVQPGDADDVRRLRGLDAQDGGTCD